MKWKSTHALAIFRCRNCRVAEQLSRDVCVPEKAEGWVESRVGQSGRPRSIPRAVLVLVMTSRQTRVMSRDFTLGYAYLTVDADLGQSVQGPRGQIFPRCFLSFSEILTVHTRIYSFSQPALLRSKEEQEPPGEPNRQPLRITIFLFPSTTMNLNRV